MISVFEGRSLESAWSAIIESFRKLQTHVHPQDGVHSGRGGPTLELLHSIIHISDPRQRWAYSRQPAMNPAFALAEVIWILAGRQDSAFLNYWNPVLPQFAGKGLAYHGAYGYRLRHSFGLDQLQRAYEALRCQPDSRQLILQIWEPALDLPGSDGVPASPDIPCNICSLLKVRSGRLEWTQVMRSNDLYRGLPHNVVQWTSVQEVLAGWLGLEVGSYVHLSDSLHVYETHWRELREAASTTEGIAEFPVNTDSLALSKDEFDTVFAIVERNTERMTQPDLTRDDLTSLARAAGIPVGYRNALHVLAADSARRRKWSETAEEIMTGCTNDAFRYLWNRWMLRNQKTQ